MERESPEISKTGNSPAKGGEWGAAPWVPEHRVGGSLEPLVPSIEQGFLPGPVLHLIRGSQAAGGTAARSHQRPLLGAISTSPNPLPSSEAEEERVLAHEALGANVNLDPLKATGEERCSRSRPHPAATAAISPQAAICMWRGDGISWQGGPRQQTGSPVKTQRAEEAKGFAFR